MADTRWTGGSVITMDCTVLAPTTTNIRTTIAAEMTMTMIIVMIAMVAHVYHVVYSVVI
jgi:hypothetical protein